MIDWLLLWAAGGKLSIILSEILETIPERVKSIRPDQSNPIYLRLVLSSSDPTPKKPLTLKIPRVPTYNRQASGAGTSHSRPTETERNVQIKCAVCLQTILYQDIYSASLDVDRQKLDPQYESKIPRHWQRDASDMLAGTSDLSTPRAI